MGTDIHGVVLVEESAAARGGETVLGHLEAEEVEVEAVETEFGVGCVVAVFSGVEREGVNTTLNWKRE